MSAVATKMEMETDPSTSNTKTVSKATTNQTFESKQEETPSAPPSLEALSIGANNKENENKNDSDCESDSDSDDSEEESSEDPMFAGLEPEQIAQMKARMGSIQSCFKEHEDSNNKRKIVQIKQEIEFNLAIVIDDELAEYINDFITNNNDNSNNEQIVLSDRLQEDGVYFLQSMKEMMQQSMDPNLNKNKNKNNAMDIYDDQDNDSDEEWNAAPKKKKKPNKGSGINADGSKRAGRLLLNDALKNADSMEGWSDARKKAWKNRKTSPNAYFYRFNVPGQPQKNGKWSKEENKLFMKRVLECGVNDKWGIFSKVIPGRVGYVCSNQWSKLIKNGDVKDLNYYSDGKKLRFHRNTKTTKISDDFRRFAFVIVRDASGTFKNLPCRHPNHPSDEFCKNLIEKLKIGLAGKNGKKRKHNDENDEDFTVNNKKKKRRRNKKKYDDNDEDEFHCKVSVDTTIKSGIDNPMPDFIDSITGENVIKPTISPYGHVLGYDTWTKILRTSKTKNVCPFTVQKLTRRSLIKLTKENYEEYKDKIKNITDEEKAMMSQIM